MKKVNGIHLGNKLSQYLLLPEDSITIDNLITVRTRESRDELVRICGDDGYFRELVFKLLASWEFKNVECVDDRKSANVYIRPLSKRCSDLPAITSLFIHDALSHREVVGEINKIELSLLRFIIGRWHYWIKNSADLKAFIDNAIIPETKRTLTLENAIKRSENILVLIPDKCDSKEQKLEKQIPEAQILGSTYTERYCCFSDKANSVMVDGKLLPRPTSRTAAISKAQQLMDNILYLYALDSSQTFDFLSERHHQWCNNLSDLDRRKIDKCLGLRFENIAEKAIPKELRYKYVDKFQQWVHANHLNYEFSKPDSVYSKQEDAAAILEVIPVYYKPNFSQIRIGSSIISPNPVQQIVFRMIRDTGDNGVTWEEIKSNLRKGSLSYRTLYDIFRGADNSKRLFKLIQNKENKYFLKKHMNKSN